MNPFRGDRILPGGHSPLFSRRSGFDSERNTVGDVNGGAGKDILVPQGPRVGKEEAHRRSRRGGGRAAPAFVDSWWVRWIEEDDGRLGSKSVQTFERRLCRTAQKHLARLELGLGAKGTRLLLRSLML